MDSPRAQRNTWKTVPLSSSILFFAGVFCLFGALLLVVESELRSRTLRFGKQTDDQTMLLIRRLA